MRVIEGENELRLTCSRSASGGIALLRCETQDDIVRLPDEIDGVPVTEVGAYVLSERAPDLTERDTFAVRITCGGTEPKHNAAAIRTVTLPKDAKSVGSYAFYNCRNLERIELTDSVSEFGGGALMNCMSLREVILHAAPSAPTCLPRLLGEYAGELDVRFDEHARLLTDGAGEQDALALTVADAGEIAVREVLCVHEGERFADFFPVLRAEQAEPPGIGVAPRRRHIPAGHQLRPHALCQNYCHSGGKFLVRKLVQIILLIQNLTAKYLQLSGDTL